MTTVSVGIADAGLGTVLQAMAAQLADMTPVYKAIGRKLESNINLRFDTKTDPSGKPWAPWAESTKEARQSEGRGNLLEYTGRMRDSLTYVLTSDSVEVGFGVEYAQYHEQLSLSQKGLPKRAMLFDGGKLSATDTEDVLAAAMKALEKQLKDAKTV